jgi:hypothetical protein
MYFIAKGKCEVKIRDKFNDRYEEKVARILSAGDHFGVSNPILIKYHFYYYRKLGCYIDATDLRQLSPRIIAHVRR